MNEQIKDEKIKDNEVYFIGDQGKKGFYRKRTFYIVIVAVFLAVIAGLIIMFSINGNKKNVNTPINGNTLDVVKVLPKGGQPPLFEGKYDISGFMNWVCQNLKYPKGFETTEAKVVVGFVIQKDGTIGQFKIISAPQNPVFADAVLSLLRLCPRWKPAKLANGKVVSMEYELPVVFKLY